MLDGCTAIMSVLQAAEREREKQVAARDKLVAEKAECVPHWDFVLNVVTGIFARAQRETDRLSKELADLEAQRASTNGACTTSM